MKKALVIISVFALALTFSTFAKAADDMDFHMNVRFWHTDIENSTTGLGQSEGRMSLHVVEFSAAKEVDNFGANLKYRIADQVGGGYNNSNQSYPVEAKVYYKNGAHTAALGLQFVPFAIYKWNNLYHPFLDIPGQLGRIWDADWGLLYTYDAKPVKLDIGIWDNAGEEFPSTRLLATNTVLAVQREAMEKNTITLRLGYDILSNWNLGFSYMDGDIEWGTANIADTDLSTWAVDTTWTPLSNLKLTAEFVDYDVEKDTTTDVNGDYGLAQIKYDIVKVPAPLNKISFVLQYSWLDATVGNVSQGKIKNYQEEIWLQVGKNLHIFWQNVQEKYPTAMTAAGAETDKYHYLAIKYNLF